MTVKGGASGAGGLAQRSEWEAPTQPGVFDFSHVDNAPLRTSLEAAKDALDGHDIYSRTVPGGLFGFIYPPFAALIFMPLAWLPLAIGIPVWQCVVLVAVFVVARILARKLSPGAYA